METIAQLLVSGVMLGGIYAVMSIGLTLIFGVLKVVNFAHGEFIMLAMYLAEPLGEFTFCEVDRSCAIAARRRANLEDVLVATLGNDVRRGDRLPMNDAMALGFGTDRNAEWRGISSSDNRYAFLRNNPVCFTLAGAWIGRVTANEDDFLAFHAALFVDHVARDFHRDVGLVAVFGPRPREGFKDAYFKNVVSAGVFGREQKKAQQ